MLTLRQQWHHSKDYWPFSKTGASLFSLNCKSHISSDTAICFQWLLIPAMMIITNSIKCSSGGGSSSKSTHDTYIFLLSTRPQNIPYGYTYETYRISQNSRHVVEGFGTAEKKSPFCLVTHDRTFC